MRSRLRWRTNIALRSFCKVRSLSVQACTELRRREIPAEHEGLVVARKNPLFLPENKITIELVAYHI